MTQPHSKVWWLAALMVAVAGCGGGTEEGGTDTTPPPPPVVGAPGPIPAPSPEQAPSPPPSPPPSSAPTPAPNPPPAPPPPAPPAPGPSPAPTPTPSANLLKTGLAQYATQCAICHDSPSLPGPDGKGIFPINTNNFSSAADLSSYITRFMPKDNPAACDKGCVESVTAFIRNNFSDVVGGGGNTANPPPPSTAFAALSPPSELRKIKNLLTGQAPTDAELAAGVSKAALQASIDKWMDTPAFQEKMLVFFANTFQQNSFSLTDFQFQLRNRPGAFNLSYGIHGDSAFPMLIKNLQESFARTALNFVQTGRPLTDLLTTDRFMMTTALKSLYMQIEANNDTASNPKVMKFKFNYGKRPPLAESLNPESENFMVFGHEPPATITGSRTFRDSCNNNANLVATFPGNVFLFHLLLGNVNRDVGTGPGLTDTGCFERATKPYFTPADLSDWQLVQIVEGKRIEPWELIKLRASGGTLPSVAQRISFFTTPAFLATWNTSDSNSHRVTVNQALLAALGQGFTSASQSIPIPPNTAALDGEHAVDSSECFACHKSLDPMRQFFQNAYLDNDKPRTGGGGAQPSFGFANVTGNGRTLVDFGNFMKQVTDERVAGKPVSRFALEMTQKLCFFANSTNCDETDPEMRRIASAFQASSFNFKSLVRDMFSSPLVTASANTKTFEKNGVSISITRRDQLCQALSTRLNVADICKLGLPAPAKQAQIATLANALPFDTFSRGVAEPVTQGDPNVFYRGASEMLCESIATQVVDAVQGGVFSSTNANAAITDMVIKVMALPATDPKHAAAVGILKAHNSAALKKGASATNALRSTFSAACLAPSSLGLGI